MIQINELKVKIGYSLNDIKEAISSKFSLPKNAIENVVIIRESLDARKKPQLYYSLNVLINVKSKYVSHFKTCNFAEPNYAGIECKKIDYNGKSPIIVGFGPAGMFAGLLLAMSGLKPVILEQGKPADERWEDVQAFWSRKTPLNVHSNVQFGEGGAGTFSDGKLNTTLHNPLCKTVINELILNGAPKEIFYKSKPHIGSDNLRKIVVNIRKKIEYYGGKVIFNTKMTDILIDEKKSLTGIKARNVITNNEQVFSTNALILAIGHSAIDTFELMYKKNFNLEQKPFAMGVRIEQKQSVINLSQYGSLDSKLPSADYKLVEHLENGRGVYTFCNCPGGDVVLSSSEEGTIVTNGMSDFARNKPNCNSALLVDVVPEDYNSSHPLAGLYYQRKYERLAFTLGGSNYNAPCERVDSFLNKPISSEQTINSSYLPALTFAKIEKCLPNFVSESLRLAIPKLNQKIENFACNNDLLIAVESRSSCPVRVPRNDETLMTNVLGVFCAGEGAGYAGGIVSSAQDGIKIANALKAYLNLD